jgi:hypothetical protein
MKRTAKKASAKKSSKAAPSKKVSPAKTPAPKAAPKVSPVTDVPLCPLSQPCTCAQHEGCGDDGLFHDADTGDVVEIACADCGVVGPEDPEASDRVCASEDGRPRCDACDAARGAK